MVLEMSFPSLWEPQFVRRNHIAEILSHSVITVTSGNNSFEILSPALKSLAVRSRVKYAPHPYVWMAPARSRPTGLGIESDGLEMPLNELPEWDESKIKILPMVGLDIYQ